MIILFFVLGEIVENVFELVVCVCYLCVDVVLEWFGGFGWVKLFGSGGCVFFEMLFELWVLLIVVCCFDVWSV